MGNSNIDVLIIDRFGNTLATAVWVPAYEAITRVVRCSGVPRIPRDKQVTVKGLDGVMKRGKYGDLLLESRKDQIPALAAAA